MHLIYVVYGPIMFQQFAIRACPNYLTAFHLEMAKMVD